MVGEMLANLSKLAKLANISATLLEKLANFLPPGFSASAAASAVAAGEMARTIEIYTGIVADGVRELAICARWRAA